MGDPDLRRISLKTVSSFDTFGASRSDFTTILRGAGGGPAHAPRRRKKGGDGEARPPRAMRQPRGEGGKEITLAWSISARE